MQFSYGTADPLAAPALAAAPTSRIDLVFSDTSSPSWEWDPTTSTWLRSQDGEPDLEASGERIRATNVVTLRVAIEWPFEEVPLTAKEFDLLYLLASHPGRVFSRNYLLDRLWGDNYTGFERTVDTHIQRLRRKLGGSGSVAERIVTLWGVGYKYDRAQGGPDSVDAR